MALLALASLGSQRVTAGDMGSAGNFQAQEMWFKKKTYCGCLWGGCEELVSGLLTPRASYQKQGLVNHGML